MAVVIQGEGASYNTEAVDANQVNEQPEIALYQLEPVDDAQVNEQPEVTSFMQMFPDAHLSNVRGEGVRYIATSLTQAAQQTIVNRVWDELLPGFVWWETEEIDYVGAHYPGPGDFETQTTDYKLETVKFTRV